MNISDSLITTIVSKLEAITKDQTVPRNGKIYGYQHTVKTADRWRTRAYAPDELPAWDVRDPLDKLETFGNSPPLSKHTVTYELYLYVGGSTPELEIREFIEDALACMGTYGQWGLDIVLKESSRELAVQQAADPYAASKLTLEIRYLAPQFEI